MNEKTNITFINIRKKEESLQDHLRLTLNLSKSKLKKMMKKELREMSGLEKRSCFISLDILNSGKVYPLFEGDHTPQIISETENFFFLHKPFKVHNYPLKYLEGDNLLSFLRQENLLNQELSIWGDFGLVNRLDFLTSGIVVCAKSQMSKKLALKNRETFFSKKYYLAIVQGDCRIKFKVKEKILSYGEKGASMKVDMRGEECEIGVELLSYDSNLDLSLVRVELFEGFRHQIRVLLASANHSIYGDPLYGFSHPTQKAPRMFLHHHELHFSDGEKKVIKDQNLSFFKKMFPTYQWK